MIIFPQEDLQGEKNLKLCKIAHLLLFLIGRERRTTVFLSQAADGDPWKTNLSLVDYQILRAFQFDTKVVRKAGISGR